ncbi:CYTH domain-containing protein [Sphingomonas cavernae]|uniref:CYTH domain-containing protein n=1 Tax=Sphingomonas cavernae TaxID=2320861 RepID=A0A418W7P8_9SPHN|nr:CYTH domain-containing protein [Sphingomonas cavernae]RJF86025.1 CYTH domain-containing protein [Sphingomonas cavernae]
MAIEIERKFLVADDRWKSEVVAVKAIRQGYLAREGAASVRVRVVDGTSAMLTVKSERGGEGRLEFEYAIPIEDAEPLLGLATGELIVKRRHLVPVTGDKLIWEVDVFEGRLAGLVLAEIELDHPGRAVDLPDWLGPEVTDDPRYQNARLAAAVGPPAIVDTQPR